MKAASVSRISTNLIFLGNLSAIREHLDPLLPTPMIRIILTTFIALIIYDVFSQTCSDCRYISPVFDSVTVKTVKFGQGPRANGNIQELYMDVYEPYGDTATNRPVLIFAFGGAFVTGSRDDWYVVLVCEHLARAGYVVASIDYRIYDDAGELALEVLGIPPRHMRIFFRPMQDMRAAVQYLKADYTELGNNYRIDTSKIIIGGASSGAITSLMVAYCDKESELAELGGGDISPIDDLGGFYTTSGLYPNYSWKSLATLNVSGAILNPDWIEPGDIPAISAHGDADNIVPYKAGAFAGITLGFFNMYGSYLVDSAARANGVCSYLYTMEGKDHPSESFGIEYIKSVVYRLMLRMHAVINNRSFCCGLKLDVSPVDTLYYPAGGAPVSLQASVSNGTGSEQIQWCSIACEATGTSSSIIVEPDTNMKYITCMAYDNQCEDVTLNMVKERLPTAVAAQIGLENSSLQIFPQPASGSFLLHAEFPEPLNHLVSLEIIDMTGRKIFNQEAYAGKSLHKIMDVHDVATGSYLLSIAAPGMKLHQKLVINR